MTETPLPGDIRQIDIANEAEFDPADLPDEDIGEPIDLDGDGIPDDLDVGDLDDLLAGVNPDEIEEPEDELEDDADGNA